ncbi:STAS domain-containing protein [Catenulispora pinisilvae]|uniref:STAS domain-containing protein n=1 Tax=Catenulispora pinisilvae TaxID=2705253 RepID=UPI001891F8E4
MSGPGTSTLQNQPPHLSGPGGSPPDPLQVGVHRHAAGWVVVLNGEWDIATAPLLTDRLGPSDGAVRSHLAADLSGLGFCDCAGLGTLVGIHRRTVEQGGRLRLCAPTARMRKLLQTTRLSLVLLCYPSVEEAFAASSDLERATSAAGTGGTLRPRQVSGSDAGRLRPIPPRRVGSPVKRVQGPFGSSIRQGMRPAAMAAHSPGPPGFPAPCRTARLAGV